MSVDVLVAVCVAVSVAVSVAVGVAVPSSFPKSTNKLAHVSKFTPTTTGVVAVKPEGVVTMSRYAPGERLVKS